MNKKIGSVAEIAWLLGVIICPLGISLSARSGLGVSMVVAPAFVLYNKLSQYFSFFTFGMAGYLVQGILIIALCLVLKRIKLKFLFSFVTAFLCGTFIDFWSSIVGKEPVTVLWQQCLFALLGALVTAFAIALMLRTYLPQEVFEVVVKEISEKYNFRMDKVKWVYDISSLVFSILLMLILFSRFSFNMIGVGTLFLTLVNAPLIAFYGKILDKYFVFDSAFKKFYSGFQKILN